MYGWSKLCKIILNAQTWRTSPFTSQCPFVYLWFLSALSVSGLNALSTWIPLLYLIPVFSPFLFPGSSLCLFLGVFVMPTKQTFQHCVKLLEHRCFETLLQSLVQSTQGTWLQLNEVLVLQFRQVSYLLLRSIASHKDSHFSINQSL